MTLTSGETSGAWGLLLGCGHGSGTKWGNRRPGRADRAPGPFRVLCFRRQSTFKAAGDLASSDHVAGHGFHRAGFRAELRVHACDGRVVFPYFHMAMRFIAATCSGDLVLSTVERLAVTALLIPRRSALGRRSLGEGNKYQRPEIRLETRRFLGRRPEFLAVCQIVDKYSDFVRVLESNGDGEPELPIAQRAATRCQGPRNARQLALTRRPTHE